MSRELRFLFLLVFISGSLEEIENMTLECLPNSIRVFFSDKYLTKNRIAVTDETELHFLKNAHCYADRNNRGYVLTLYQPYNSCGTTLEHDTDNYVYRNIIAFSPQPNKTQALLNFTCEYEDEYVISSNVSLTPNIKVLNFVTSQGKLSVEMNLYQRSDYHPKSKLGHRPRIIVGVPVYVSVDMLDVFGNEDIVVTLQSCYATTHADYQSVSRDSYHFLITSRCASPQDRTVEITSNGISFRSRFSFQMFQWKNKIEYIYLHCEVLICNKTKEICTGTGPLCDGFRSSLFNTRGRRNIPEVRGSTGFISTGPISMAKLENGEATFHTFESSPKVPIAEIKEKSQKLLLTYVFGSLATVLVLIGISLLLLIVIRKSRLKNKKYVTAIPRNFTNNETYLPRQF